MKFPERIGGEVDRELRRFGPAGAMGEIVKAWPAAVGDSIARNAWPARLGRDGTLHVNAVSATWAFELGRMSATILEQLRTHLRGRTPPALKVTPGPVPEPERDPAAQDASRRPEIGAKDRVEAAALAAAIDDEELRELVARVAAASLARARSGRRF